MKKELDDTQEMEKQLERKDIEIRELTLSIAKKEERITSMEENQNELCVRLKQLLEAGKRKNEEMKRISEEQQEASEQIEEERVLNSEIKETNEKLRKEMARKNLKIEQQAQELSTYSKQKELNEQLKKEATRKTNQIEELSDKLKESNETSKNLKIKLQISCENVNDLAEDIRGKKNELKEQDQKISLLIQQAEESKEQMRQLNQSIEQVKDENTKIKNQTKVIRQENNLNSSPEIAQLFQKFEEFKKDISNKLLLFTKQCDESDPNQIKKKERRKKKKKRIKKSVESSEDDSETGESEKESDYGETENEQIILRPGPLKYSEAVKNTQKDRKTLVLSTSITRDIKEERFNECFSDGNAEFVRLRGWKAKSIKEDVKKNLQHGYFDSAIVHVGGNDLQDLYYPESFEKLAKEVMETGLICRERGAETVFIAGVTVRKWQYTWERCRLLNGRLKALCRENNFVYIDNSNINYVDHLDDEVHLNEDGSKILARNYLGCMYKAFKSHR